MSNRQNVLRSGASGLAAPEVNGCERQTGYWSDDSVDSDSGDDYAAVGAVSSSSSCGGSGSGGGSRDGSNGSGDSSPFFFEGYGCSADRCCTGGRAVWLLSLAGRGICCPDARRKVRNAGVVASANVKSNAIPSRWTMSSLLCGVSILLGACSLSSLAVCIAVTGVSLSCVELSRVIVAASAAEDGVTREDIDDSPQIDSWTERLMQPLLADHESVSSQRASKQRFLQAAYLAKRYSWDCISQPGHTKCSPVQKAQSRRDGARLSSRRKYHPTSAEFHAVEDGVYHISAQIAGSVWQPPPTLLRAVIVRIKPKSEGVNVIAVHSITGAVDGGASAKARRGTFSVYTAATMLLSVGDELQTRIICVEAPDCIVHINGTASYVTLERLQ